MTQPYRDRSFAQRFSAMGDEAESVWLEVKPLGPTTRFGFRRPEGIKFGSIPPLFRHAPDFITSLYLVEVMGLGRDGILKSVKVDKYEALKSWNDFSKRGLLLGVVLFLWNSSEKQYLILPWTILVDEVQYSKRKHGGPLAFSNDGNEYYPLEWSRLKAKAQLVGVYDG